MCILADFEAVFLDFVKDFVSDEQTFIGVKQHPQAGPGTTHIMCVKYENFLKNRFFDFFWTNSYGGPPHNYGSLFLEEFEFWV